MSASFWSLLLLGAGSGLPPGGILRPFGPYWISQGGWDVDADAQLHNAGRDGSFYYQHGYYYLRPLPKGTRVKMMVDIEITSGAVRIVANDTDPVTGNYNLDFAVYRTGVYSISYTVGDGDTTLNLFSFAQPNGSCVCLVRAIQLYIL